MAVTHRNPYDVLGVPAAASAEEIHDAYRRLAKRWHPDLNPGDPVAEATFKEIAGAYETLSHEDRRAAFYRDTAAHRSEEGGERPPYPSDDAFTAAPEAASSMSAYVEELREIRNQNQRKPSIIRIAVAAYVALTFINGMVLGYTTALNGLIVSERSINTPFTYSLFYVGTFWNIASHSYSGRSIEYTIRRADGQLETYVTGPACSLLTSGRIALCHRRASIKTLGRGPMSSTGGQCRTSISRGTPIASLAQRCGRLSSSSSWSPASSIGRGEAQCSDLFDERRRRDYGSR